MTAKPEQYSIWITQVELEDEVYYEAKVREFGDLAEYGETHSEAYELMLGSLKATIKDFDSRGKAYPPPTSKKLNAYSGRMSLRMPISLHESLALKAADDETSLNNFIVTQLALAAGRNFSPALPARITHNVPDIQALPIFSWSDEDSRPEYIEFRQTMIVNEVRATYYQPPHPTNQGGASLSLEVAPC